MEVILYLEQIAWRLWEISLIHLLSLKSLFVKICRTHSCTCSNQVIRHDGSAALMKFSSTCCSMSCEKIAVAISHYKDVQKYMSVKSSLKKGKKEAIKCLVERNPVLRGTPGEGGGACRMIRSYAIPAMENVALWHERDISHSSVERFILPDGFITTDFYA